MISSIYPFIYFSDIIKDAQTFHVDISSWSTYQVKY